MVHREIKTQLDFCTNFWYTSEVGSLEGVGSFDPPDGTGGDVFCPQNERPFQFILRDRTPGDSDSHPYAVE